MTCSSRLRGVPMTDRPDQELPRAQRRRLIAGAVLRALLSTTAHDVVRPHQHPQDDPAAVLPRRSLRGHQHAAGLAHHRRLPAGGVRARRPTAGPTWPRQESDRRRPPDRKRGSNRPPRPGQTRIWCLDNDQRHHQHYHPDGHRRGCPVRTSPHAGEVVAVSPGVPGADHPSRGNPRAMTATRGSAARRVPGG